LTVVTHGSSGTVQFANLGTSNQVYEADGMTPVSAGAGFVASLAVGATPGGLTVLPNSASFILPGRFLGGTRTVPFISPGFVASAQVRVWDSTISSSYEEAVALGARHGTSAVFQITLGGGIIPPGSLSLMKSFSLSAGTGVKSRKSLSSTTASASLARVSASSDSLSFLMRGTIGAYAIEASSNLDDWAVVGYVLNNSGAVRFEESGMVSRGRRFYRARFITE
jgi:hypothetical protein